VATARQARGAYGERRAATWYEQRGFQVLARNWRSGRTGELDLVLRRDRLVVFCEVKARRTEDFGVAEAVTPQKQARIRRLAAAYLAHAELGSVMLRFDVACVVGTRLEVIESAF